MNKSFPTDKATLHYGWIIAATGVAVVFSAIGLGRFSLGMLLPYMEASLELSYSQMGLIGTGNFVGYMISVVLAGIVARIIGARSTISLGLVMVGSTMALISFANEFIEVILLFIATGIGSGLANIPMMGLASHWFNNRTRGGATGTMVSGNGIAIVFAGLFIPWATGAGLFIAGWRASWLIFGITSLLIASIAALFLRNEPAEKGLLPLGQAGRPSAPALLNSEKGKQQGNKKILIHMGCINALFGATHAVYTTFIVTAMVNERGFSEGTAGTFWAVVGGLSIFSGPLFGRLSDKLGRKSGIMIAYMFFTLAYVLVGADLPNAFLYGSIGIFGLAMWSIPTLMVAAVGDYMGPAQAVKALGFITLFFGAGQIAGPAVAGFLADATGTFKTSFILCAVLTTFAIGLTSFLKQPEAE